MYPMLCMGGYPFPIKKGRGLQIAGISITASNPAAATRCTFIDSDAFKELTDDQTLKPVIADLKGLANADGVISWFFPSPIKVRKGITIANGTNLIAGRIFVYVE